MQESKDSCFSLCGLYGVGRLAASVIICRSMRVWVRFPGRAPVVSKFYLHAWVRMTKYFFFDAGMKTLGSLFFGIFGRAMGSCWPYSGNC